MYGLQATFTAKAKMGQRQTCARGLSISLEYPGWAVGLIKPMSNTTLTARTTCISRKRVGYKEIVFDK